MRQKRQIIRTCALQKGIKDVNTFVFWYSTANVTTVRWNNVKTAPKPSKSKSDCTKNLEKQGQESTPTNKCGKERINRSQDPVQEPNELTRKLDGNGTFLLPHPARLRHGGNHQTNGGRHGLGMNIELFFITIARCFSHRQWQFPLYATGGVNTTPIPRPFVTSAHVNFSLVAQVCVCVS